MYNYRLLTKYREICPTAVVVRRGPELATRSTSVTDLITNLSHGKPK